MLEKSGTQERFVQHCFKDGKESYPFLEDKQSGFIYNQDTEDRIKWKCTKCILGTPFVTVARVISSIARTVFHLMKAVWRALTLDKRCIDSIVDSGKAFADIFRSVMYGVALEGAAIYGRFVNQYKGRVYYGNLERALNRHGDRPSFSKRFYAARCFQPVAKMSDENCLERIHTVYDKQRALYRAEAKGEIPTLDGYLMWVGLKGASDIFEKIGFSVDPETFEYHFLEGGATDDTTLPDMYENPPTNLLAFLGKLGEAGIQKHVDIFHRLSESGEVKKAIDKQRVSFPCTRSTEKVDKLVHKHLQSNGSVLKGELKIGSTAMNKDRYLTVRCLDPKDYANRELDLFIRNTASMKSLSQKYGVKKSEIRASLLKSFEESYAEALKVERIFAEKALKENDLSPKEKKCIALITKAMTDKDFNIEGEDLKLVKAFISDAVGNVSLNSRIEKYKENTKDRLTDEQKRSLDLFHTFTFKTLDIEPYHNLLESLTELLELRKSGETIPNEKKLSLKQVGMLDKSSALQSMLKKLDRVGLIDHDPRLSEFKSDVDAITKEWKKIESEAKKASAYKTGDLVMYDSDKFSGYLGKKLDSMVAWQTWWLNTAEFHAAMIDDEPTRRGSTLKVAHIQPEGFKKGNIQFGQLAYATGYRLDVQRLVNRDMRKQIQYLLRQNGRPDTNWKEYVQEKYEEAVGEILRNQEQFEGMKNPDSRRLKSILPGHHTAAITDFENFAFEDNKKQICSEFTAVIIAKAVARANTTIQQELADAGIKVRGTVISNPISSHEKLRRIHTARLIEILRPHLIPVEKPNVVQELVQI